MLVVCCYKHTHTLISLCHLFAINANVFRYNFHVFFSTLNSFTSQPPSPFCSRSCLQFDVLGERRQKKSGFHYSDFAKFHPVIRYAPDEIIKFIRPAACKPRCAMKKDEQITLSENRVAASNLTPIFLLRFGILFTVNTDPESSQFQPNPNAEPIQITPANPMFGFAQCRILCSRGSVGVGAENSPSLQTLIDTHWVRPSSPPCVFFYSSCHCERGHHSFHHTAANRKILFPMINNVGNVKHTPIHPRCNLH